MLQHNVYLSDSSVMEADTVVLAARRMSTGQAIAVRENLHRPSGGGEPADRGRIILPDGTYLGVAGVEKVNGYTWIIIPDSNIAMDVGTPIVSSLDANYRNRKRHLHSLIHITLAVAVRRFSGLSVECADISPDAEEALIIGSWSEKIGGRDLVEIDRDVRNIVMQSRPIVIDKARSIDQARLRFGPLFRISDRYHLSGRVRLVVIENIDVNPCSGTHADTTGIGCYEMFRQLDGKKPNRFSLRLRPTDSWMYWLGPEI
jgi:Ser-tRNA(Ala) deacylase AlaX